MDQKKRHIISIEKLPADVLAAFNEKYPEGLESCEDDLREYPKPNGESFYAVSIEMDNDIYLIKIPIERDDFIDVESWLDRSGESEIEEIAGTSCIPIDADDTIPDNKELEDLSKEEEEDEERFDADDC